VISAVEQLLTTAVETSAGPVTLLAMGLLVIVLVGLLAYLIWVAVV
jgi:hypothetical protein